MTTRPAAAAAPLVPVSWGELLDKITILELKAERIEAPAGRANVRRELEALGEALARARDAAGLAADDPALARLLRELRQVNETLWTVEDELRAAEAAQAFDARFVALARAVYRTNDRRAAIKRAINRHLGSALVEEKSYASASPAAAAAAAAIA